MAHGAHSVEEVFGATEPAAHASHEDKPSSVLNDPFGQSMQSQEPSELYEPAEQSSHNEAPSKGACFPLKHEAQLVDLLTATALPLSQLRHTLWPVPPWYLPMAHSAHSVDNVFGATEPAAHASHEDKPSRSEKLPVLHCLHKTCPGASWNSPERQD